LGAGRICPNVQNKIFSNIQCVLNKGFTKIFSLKPLLKRAINLKRFVAVQYWSEKDCTGEAGLGAGPPAAGGKPGSGGGTSRAWRLFTNFFQTIRNFKHILIHILA